MSANKLYLDILNKGHVKSRSLRVDPVTDAKLKIMECLYSNEFTSPTVSDIFRALVDIHLKSKIQEASSNPLLQGQLASIIEITKQEIGFDLMENI